MVCHAHHLALTPKVKVTNLVKNLLFQNVVMLRIKLKGKKNMTTKGQGHKIGKKYTFSECGHVAYQIIKENETYDNIQANILTLHG